MKKTHADVKIAYRYGKSHIDMENFISIWKISYRYGKSHIDIEIPIIKKNIDT